MAKYYLAVDIGASSGRLILGHLENGKMELEEVHRFENGMVKKDGELCWEFDRLFKEIKNGLKKCKEIGKIPVVFHGTRKTSGAAERQQQKHRDYFPHNTAFPSLTTTKTLPRRTDAPDATESPLPRMRSLRDEAEAPCPGSVSGSGPETAAAGETIRSPSSQREAPSRATSRGARHSTRPLRPPLCIHAPDTATARFSRAVPP